MTYTANKIHNITNGTTSYEIVTAVREDGKEIAFKMNGHIIKQINYNTLAGYIRYGYFGDELMNKINS